MASNNSSIGLGNEDKGIEAVELQGVNADESTAVVKEQAGIQDQDAVVFDVEHDPSASTNDVATPSSLWGSIHDRLHRRGLPRYHLLVTDTNARKYSLWALQFNVLANAINTKLLNPNFAIMASPGATSDSFPNTIPFEFNSATYFLPLTNLLGVAIASTYTGQLSDRIGRKKVIFVTSILSGFGSIGMYFARKSFWGFCAMSFVAGLFKGTLPVAMAYVGDVFPTRQEKANQLGTIVGCFVLGNSGGGILAILMEDSGLFTPLLLGAAVIFLSAIIVTRVLIEPGDVRLIPVGKEKLQQDTDDDDEDRPETIEQCTLWNIIGGALLDNIGSTALFPLCLSPLALEQYFLQFAQRDEDPIMTITVYKWLSVLVALMVIPSTIFTPHIFSKLGAAGGCVLGNAFTALITIALLFIANGPATTSYFAAFVTVMYAGFPLTVMSQLSTGPMLDVIAPLDKLGYVQGLNNTVMNFGMAVAPWIFGLLADVIGTNPAIWIGIGVSFLAALMNAPLMRHAGFGPAKKKLPPSRRPFPGEDKELVENILRGEWVPPEDMHALNMLRVKNGQPFLVPLVRSYQDDKDHMTQLRDQAHATFEFHRDRNDRILTQIADPDTREKIPELCEGLNTALRADAAVVDQLHQDLGRWFADYLKDNGYRAHVQPVAIKQMVLTALPTISQEQDITPENLEQTLLNGRRIFNQYLDLPQEERYSLGLVLGNGGTPIYYS